MFVNKSWWCGYHLMISAPPVPRIVKVTGAPNRCTETVIITYYYYFSIYNAPKYCNRSEAQYNSSTNNKTKVEGQCTRIVTNHKLV